MLLLDTNIVSYFIYNADWKNLYVPMLKGKTLYIAFMTLAEMLEGARHRGLSEKNFRAFTQRLHEEYIVIPWNEEICDRFAQIRVQRRQKPISVPDALIAATALTYDLPLVTHNEVDFKGIDGLDVKTKYRKGE